MGCIVSHRNTMDDHPILGKNIMLGPEQPIGRVYTRTMVLWAVGITIDPRPRVGARRPARPEAV